MRGLRHVKQGIALTLLSFVACTQLYAQEPATDNNNVAITEVEDGHKDGQEPNKGKKEETKKTDPPRTGPSKPVTPTPKPVSTGDFILSFHKYLDGYSHFFSNYGEDSLAISDYIDNLRNRTDREEYIQKNSLNSLVLDQKDSILLYDSICTVMIDDFIATKYKNRTFESESECKDSAIGIIKQKLDQRRNGIADLDNACNNIFQDNNNGWSFLNEKMLINVLIVLLVIGLLVFWIRKTRKKKGNQRQKEVMHTVSAQEAAKQIVVRRKTTSILRQQSLEDVQDNPEYLAIDTKDFCKDSAVRRIYLKNTCIKGIYNMYDEDLNNPNHPNEDGCMVLGRWVLDKETNEYYVSLEDIVFPGDDAVFTEYELNFGAKIKLKVTERLRKLRKDTDKQYDLTCWVHSHPGLTVFFSNYDENVQQQLKHPTHPNFLTAIVVDILTPDKELGIFTFKKDGTVNSRGDLQKLYSLEKLYKWAVESARKTFNSDEYYDILAKAIKKGNDCHGIHLNSSSMTDIRKIADDQGDGAKAMVYGTTIKRGPYTDYLVKKVSEETDSTGMELLGVFMVTSSYSIPTIRRTLTEEIGKIKFAMVYTTNDDMLNGLPVVDHELLTDVEYNGENKFDDLKIWKSRNR